MSRGLKRTASVLALSAAMAAAGSIESMGGAEASGIPGKAIATQEAAKITREFDKNGGGSLEVAPVPGILKGLVEIVNVEIGSSNIIRNPVLLWGSHSNTQIEKNHKLIDGSWIGIPIVNNSIQLVLYPYRIELGRQRIPGTQYFEITTIHMGSGSNAILEGYGVEVAPPPYTVPQGLLGVNLQNTTAPGIPITDR